MTNKLIFSGFGGQGIMFLGKLLVSAALKEGKFVSWIPAYGAEVRGGTSYCAVVISDAEVASPFVDKPDILIAMNQPSLDKFSPKVISGGTVVVNSTLANGPISRKDVKVILGAFTDAASKLGEVRIANMVALGTLIESTKVVALESIYAVLNEMIPASRKYIMQANIQAIEEGRKLK